MPNLNTNESQNNKKSSKYSWIIYAVMVVCIAVIVLVVFMITIGDNKRIAQSTFSLDYVVNANPENDCLNVDISINIAKLSQDRVISFYKGLMSANWLGCTDDFGAEIPFADTTDLIVIGPIGENITKLNFKYDISLGQLSDPLEEIPYTQGCIFDDLITFSGEYALLTPFLDPDYLDSIGKYVTNASFEFIIPDGWQSIIPYQQPLDDQHSFAIDKPDWDFFNSISKSAFCFGQFDHSESSEYEMIFVDKGAMNEISQYPLDALMVFLDYYTTVFGETLNNVPIVLLRNHPYDNSIIVGGVGSQGSALSINLRMGEDFRALSNLVFHSFFDSKIKPRNLRYATNNWIYEGLAEYYVSISAGILPDYIKDAYSIGSVPSTTERHLRYLYFSLKEPGFLALSPADEMSMYTSQEEFYMGVKVPLIIDIINHTIEIKTEQTDGFIKSLVENGLEEKPLDVEKLLKGVCGTDYEAIKNYIAGRALVPNYNNYNINSMPPEDILYMLDQDEQLYSYLFYNEQAFYPYAPLFLLNENAFMSEVTKRDIHYNTDEIQDEVKNFSSVLHRLLLQHAMWASLADIDDITRPNIIRELTQNKVAEDWSALCQEIGYELELSSID